MKLTNLIALPFAMIADAATLGESGMTRGIIRDERAERDIEAINAVVKLAEALNRKGENDE